MEHAVDTSSRALSSPTESEGSLRSAKKEQLLSLGGRRPGFASRYMRFLVKYRRHCNSFWFLMVVLGVLFGLKFLHNTTQDFNPPASTKSAKARVALGKSFPALDNTGAIIVVVEATHCDDRAAQCAALTSEGKCVAAQCAWAALGKTCKDPPFPECLVNGNSIQTAMAGLDKDIVAWNAKHGSVPDGPFPSFLLNSTQPSESYFTFKQQQLGLLAHKLVSSTNDTAEATGRPVRSVTIMNLALHEDDAFQGVRHSFVAWLQEQLDTLTMESNVGGSSSVLPLTFAATGQDVFNVDVAKKAIADITLHDGIVLPIAILVLGTIVKSARLMLIPISLVVVSFLTSFLIMYPVSLNMNVITFCPSIMMSAIIALSIDYSLFTLSRFAEERAKQRSMRESVLVMLGSAGHTVAVSGSTLTLCFLGLVAFPLDLMQSLGLGAAVSIVCTMGVNLNLGPCLLLTFPGFFGSRNPCCCRLPEGCPGCGGGGGKGDALESPLLVGVDSDSDEDDRAPDDDDDGENEEMADSIWYKIGKVCLGLPPHHWLVPVGVLVACLALVVPFSLRAFDFTASIELSLMLPRGSASAAAFTTMQDSFGDGTVFPYTLLVRPANPAQCKPASQEFFKDVNDLVNDLSSVPNTNITGITGASYLGVNLAPTLDGPVAAELLQALDIWAKNLSKAFPKVHGALECLDDTLYSLRAQEAPVLNTLYNRSWATWALAPGNCETIMNTSGTAISDATLAAQLTAIISDPHVLNETGYACVSNALTALTALNAVTFLLKYLGPTLDQYCRATQLFNHQSITHPNDKGVTPATYLSVRLDIDPYSPTGVTWLKDARGVLDTFVAAEDSPHCPGGLQLYLSGAAALGEDAVLAVYEVFPYMITATLATSFLVVGVAFRSVFVPLRAVVTICLTLLWVYGLAVMVYVDGAWDGLGMPGLAANVHPRGEINWFAPIMCFSILVGLGLDYDIFLLTRIVEYRDMGYTEKASTMMGLCKTGGIITAAGVIMAIAFSGLLFSSEMLLNQCSFYLVFAVLVDTFVVRTIMVPAIMGFAGRANWWPRRVPTPSKELLEFSSGTGQVSASAFKQFRGRGVGSHDFLASSRDYLEDFKDASPFDTSSQYSQESRS